MLAFLLLSIMSNAFIILRFSSDQFYKLHRYSGQLLYIKAIFIGTFTTIVAFFIDFCFGVVNVVSAYLPEYSILPLNNQEYKIKELIIFFSLSLFLAVLYCLFKEICLILKGRYKFGARSIKELRELTKIYLMYQLLCDSPLDKMLFDSYLYDIYLLISMSDRKVYVGRVINLGEPNEHTGPDQEILIVPVFSGYRDKDDMRLTLTTLYNTEEDISIILRQDNIVSVCEFIEPLYEKVSEQHNFIQSCKESD